MTAFSVYASAAQLRRADPAPLVTREGGRTVVWLAGENDIATSLVLANTLARVISTDDADLVIDLGSVTFIGSATIQMFIRGRNILHRQSRSLTLREPSRCAARVLDVCGLSDLIEPSFMSGDHIERGRLRAV